MALEVTGQRFCKLTHTENGKVMSRRIHSMVVQATDGRIHYLTGKQLPEYISLHTGELYSGAHLAEVLMRPGIAKLLSLPISQQRWPSMRDAFHIIFGMFLMLLIMTLTRIVAASMGV